MSTNPNDRLNFSRDSILFDTVFTSVGSVTKRIKILNRNNSPLNISEIMLAGGNSSAFSMNINGDNANSTKDIIINAGDSINVFVKVTIDPNEKNSPFVVQDSILFSTNGNRQAIHLMAYGQNAVFIKESSIISNTTWSSKLPYVITGQLTIKDRSTLTILPGARLYFHNNAGLNVEGILIAKGSVNNPLLFCSDRLENVYAEEPGQWKGIYIRRTGSGLIQFATIKNASVGITSDSLSTNTQPKLILSNAIIKNMQVAGYIGYHSELIAFNNLFYNCGNYLLYAVGGGDFNLKQNTFAGYNLGFPRKTAALSFSDYLSTQAYNNLNINLTNNIIWGQLSNELDIQKKTNATMQTNISNNLVKTTSANYNNNGNVINIDPGFISSTTENFKLTNASPALVKGYNLRTDPYFNDYLKTDLLNISRVFPSTLGCFEKN